MSFQLSNELDIWVSNNREMGDLWISEASHPTQSWPKWLYSKASIESRQPFAHHHHHFISSRSKSNIVNAKMDVT